MERRRSLNSSALTNLPPLLSFAAQGSLVDVKDLLSKGDGTVDDTDEDQRTLLHHAARGGHDELIFYLLREGSDVEAKNKHGQTPLHEAAYCGHSESVSALLSDSKISPNARQGDGRVALHGAAHSGHIDVVEKLIDSGANVNMKGHDGSTPLHVASLQGHDDVVHALLEAGAGVNAKSKSGRTPLHWAASNGHEGAICRLVQGGADIYVKNDLGKTALDVAASEAIRKLILEEHNARLQGPRDSWQVKQLEDELKSLKKTNEQLRKKVDALEAEMVQSVSRETHEHVIQARDDAERETKSLTTKVAHLSREVQQEQSEKESLKRQLKSSSEDTSAEVAKLEKKCHDADSLIRELEEKLRSSSSQKSAIEKDLSSKLQTSSAHINRAAEKCRELEDELSRREKSIREYEHQIDTMERQNTELETELSRIRSDSEKKESTLRIQTQELEVSKRDLKEEKERVSQFVNDESLRFEKQRASWEAEREEMLVHIERAEKENEELRNESVWAREAVDQELRDKSGIVREREKMLVEVERVVGEVRMMRDRMVSRMVASSIPLPRTRTGAGALDASNSPQVRVSSSSPHGSPSPSAGGRSHSPLRGSFIPVMRGSSVAGSPGSPFAVSVQRQRQLFDDAIAELSHLSAFVDSVFAAVDKRQLERDAKREEAESAKTALHEYTTSQKQLSFSLETAQKTIADREKECADLRSDIARMAALYTESQKAEENAKSERDTANRNAFREEEKAKKERAEASDKCHMLEKEIHSMEEAMRQKEAEKNNIIEELRSAMSRKEAEVVRTMSEAEDWKSKYHAMNGEHQKLGHEREQLKKSKTVGEAELSKLQNELSNMTLSLQEAEERVNRAEASAKDHKSLLDEKQTEYSANVLEARRGLFTATEEKEEAQRQSVSARRKVEEITAEKDHLEKLLKSTNEELRTLQEHSHKEGTESATQLRELQVEVQTLQRKVFGLEAEGQSMEQKMLQAKQQATSLKEENDALKARTKELTEMYAKEQSAGGQNEWKMGAEVSLLSQKLEAEEARRRGQEEYAEELNRENLHLKSELDTINRELAHAVTEFEGHTPREVALQLADSVQKLRAELQECRENMRVATMEKETIEEELHVARKGLSEAEAKANEYVSDLREANALLKSIERKDEEEAKWYSQQENAFTNLRTDAQLLEDKVRSQEVKIESLESQLKASKGTVEVQTRKTEEIRLQLDESYRNLRESEQKRREAEAEASRLRRERDTDKEKIGRLHHELQRPTVPASSHSHSHSHSRLSEENKRYSTERLSGHRGVGDSPRSWRHIDRRDTPLDLDNVRSSAVGRWGGVDAPSRSRLQSYDRMGRSLPVGDAVGLSSAPRDTFSAAHSVASPQKLSSSAISESTKSKVDALHAKLKEMTT